MVVLYLGVYIHRAHFNSSVPSRAHHPVIASLYSFCQVTRVTIYHPFCALFCIARALHGTRWWRSFELFGYDVLVDDK